MDNPTVTVLGASGKTGRRVVAALSEQGHRVRAASRRSGTYFDWEDETTWPTVLADAEAIYLIAYEATGGNTRLAALARRAADSGVKRLVFLSGRQWNDVSFEAGLEREEIIRDAGTGWTILRPVWFAQNFSEEAFLRDGIMRGELVFGTGDGRHPFVDVEDIAAVAAAALTSDLHRGCHYELSGPRAITVGEAVDTIAEALGRPIRARPASAGEYRRHLVENYDYSDDAAEETVALLELIRRGEDAHLSDGVQRVVGRQPRDFTEYARAAVAAGAWSPRAP